MTFVPTRKFATNSRSICELSRIIESRGYTLIAAIGIQHTNTIDILDKMEMLDREINSTATVSGWSSMITEETIVEWSEEALLALYAFLTRTRH